MDLEIGVFVTVQVYMIQIFAPLFFLGTIFNMAVTGFVDMYHFCKLMQEDNIIRDKPNATELNVTNPTIEFKNVYFKYSEKTDNNFNIQSNNHQDSKPVGTTINGNAIVTPSTEPDNKIDTEGANGNT